MTDEIPMVKWAAHVPRVRSVKEEVMWDAVAFTDEEINRFDCVIALDWWRGLSQDKQREAVEAWKLDVCPEIKREWEFELFAESPQSIEEMWERFRNEVA